MALVFKTDKDSPDNVEIVGAGVAFAGGKGGVPVEVAARIAPELQVLDESGNPEVDDDDNAIPLSGKKLEEAAKEFADARGLKVARVSDTGDSPEEKLLNLQAKLAQDAGMPADRPPAAEVAEEEWVRTYGGLEPVNDDPDAAVEGGPEQGAPDAADSAGEEGGN